MSSSENLLGIGTLARLTDVPKSTLRYYESIGILHPVQRINGIRKYGAESVASMNFIKAAKKVGLTLDEIRDILTHPTKGKRANSKLQGLAQQKLHEIDMLITHAKAVKKILEKALACRCNGIEDCLLFK